MRPLTSSELVEFWEHGAGMAPADRAVALLEAAGEHAGPPAADLTVGERDRRLMRLRCWLFGPQVSGVTSCGRCGELLDVAFDLGELMAAAGPATGAPITVRWEDKVLHGRAPTTADLRAAAEEDPCDISGGLLARCVTVADASGQAGPGGDPVTALPASAVAEVGSALSAADPLADVRLAVTCRECGHQWDTAFDVVLFLWAEICGSVERILGEVHLLASAYGWSEAEVLAVGPRRRQYYLEAVGG